MTNFDKWNDRYRKNWCTKDQLQRLVVLSVLTDEEYEKITEEEKEQQ